MTTLRKAPVILGNIGRDPAIRRAASRIRSDFPDAPKDGADLRRLDGDIWAIDGPLGLHRDGTAPRHRVIGVVLVNDPGLVLFTNRDEIYDLPVGAIYHIDGRRTHGALSRNGCKTGLFGFLAWDVPQTLPVQELVDDLLPSLRAYAAREERVNILPPV